MEKYNILIGDITSDDKLKNHDLIINPTNPRMVCGAGVSGAIFKKAGVDALENYTQAHYNISFYTTDNLMEIGEIRITPGFNLGMDIMFVQGPKEWEFDNSEEILFNTYKNMLNEIYKNNYKSVLLPSLGTGDYGFDHKKIGKRVSKIIKDFVSDKDINIDLVLYNECDKEYY